MSQFITRPTAPVDMRELRRDNASRILSPEEEAKLRKRQEMLALRKKAGINAQQIVTGVNDPESAPPDALAQVRQTVQGRQNATVLDRDRIRAVNLARRKALMAGDLSRGDALTETATSLTNQRNVRDAQIGAAARAINPPRRAQTPEQLRASRQGVRDQAIGFFNSEATRIRNELAPLQAKVEAGTATPDEAARFSQLGDELTQVDRTGRLVQTNQRLASLGVVPDEQLGERIFNRQQADRAQEASDIAQGQKGFASELDRAKAEAAARQRLRDLGVATLDADIADQRRREAGIIPGQAAPIAGDPIAQAERKQAERLNAAVQANTDPSSVEAIGAELTDQVKNDLRGGFKLIDDITGVFSFVDDRGFITGDATQSLRNLDSTVVTPIEELAKYDVQQAGNLARSLLARLPAPGKEGVFFPARTPGSPRITKQEEDTSRMINDVYFRLKSIDRMSRSTG